MNRSCNGVVGDLPGLSAGVPEDCSPPPVLSSAAASAPGASDSDPSQRHESSSDDASEGGASARRAKKRYHNLSCFNVFFMLERQLLLQARGGGIDALEERIDTSDAPFARHEELRLPPLSQCKRYSRLPLTDNWFLEIIKCQNKKRPHRKSRGLIPFKELAQTVAENYRSIDAETQAFVDAVAEKLRQHLDGVQGAERGDKAGIQSKETKKGKTKKRKDPPPEGDAPTGIKQGSLSEAEAATVEQLIGMKAQAKSEAPTSHSPPARAKSEDLSDDRQPGAGNQAAVPPARPAPAVAPIMKMNRDPELDRLQDDLKSALAQRCDLDQRILRLRDMITDRAELLKQKLIAATLAQARARRDPPSAAPARAAAADPDALRAVERALIEEAAGRTPTVRATAEAIFDTSTGGALREALATWRGGAGDVAAGPVAAPPAWIFEGEDGGGEPPKKQRKVDARASDDGGARATAAALTGGKSDPEGPAPQEYAGQGRGSVPVDDPADGELELYKELYAKLLLARATGPRPLHAPTPGTPAVVLPGVSSFASLDASQASATRDLAYYESLVRSAVQSFGAGNWR